MSNSARNPYDMDSTTFDSEKYLEKLLKVKEFCTDFTTRQFQYVQFLGLHPKTNNGHRGCRGQGYTNFTL